MDAADEGSAVLSGGAFGAAADRLPVICFEASEDASAFAFNRRWAEQVADDGGNVAALAEAIRDARGTGSVGARLELTGADGTPRPFLTQARLVPAEGGAAPRWIGTCTGVAQQLASERAHAFLLRLGDEIRDESNPETILSLASEAVGRELGVDRVVYATVNWEGGLLHVRRDWRANGTPVAAHRFPMADYSDEYIERYSLGEAISSADVELDEDVPEAMRRRCLDSGIHAFLSVPLVKRGTLTAFMAAQQFAPRRWTEDELRLLEEVADRTWATLERAEAAAALRESEQLFRKVTEAHPIPVVIADDGGLILGNPAFYEMMDVSPGDAVDVDPRAWASGGFQWDEFAAFVRAHRRYDNHEIYLVRRGGARFPAAISWRHISYRSEPAVICSFVDLTERKRAEEELARSREKLHQAEKLTALGGLLAGVSHELNNPLTIVTAQAALLEEMAAGSPMAGRAAKVRLAAERCSRVVQTFLAMARQKEPERRVIALEGVLRAALGLNEYALRTAGIAVSLELEPGLPPLHADPDQLHQVFVNLIVNAQQSLQDKTGERRLTVRASAQSDRIVVDVIDNGAGVPAEIRRRVFDPFFTTKPEGVGTGVGLSFSLGIVEAHGGKLELVGAPHGESGACFRVTLDAAQTQAPAAPEPKAVPAAPEAPAKGSALIVDDEEDVADVLAAIAGRAGYRVDLAANGREAIERLAAADYDVILSDLRMPVLDGPGLFDWIRRERPHLAGRIGFVTGDTLSDLAARFVRECGRPVLEKPFSGKSVRALLETLARRD